MSFLKNLIETRKYLARLIFYLKNVIKLIFLNSDENITHLLIIK